MTPSPPSTSSSTGTSGRAPGWLLSHPWILPLVVGLVLVGLPTLRGLAVFLLFAGTLGAVGSRRVERAVELRRSGIREIDRMDGTTFEHYLEELLRSYGYRVTHLGRAGDFGADLLVESNGRRAVVQAKRYSSTVGIDAVREAATARQHYRADGAIVITNSSFTRGAIELSRSNQVELWDRPRLLQLASSCSSIPAPSGPVLLAREIGAGMWVVLRALGIIALVSLGADSARRRGREQRRRRRRRSRRRRR